VSAAEVFVVNFIRSLNLSRILSVGILGEGEISFFADVKMLFCRDQNVCFPRLFLGDFSTVFFDFSPLNIILDVNIYHANAC
jgi:hypothetical protein